MAWTPEPVVLTCEHAVPTIPARYRALFAGSQGLLRTHRAFDRGALEAARLLSRKLRVPVLAGRASRLLVDLNRSEGHPACFSPRTRALTAQERTRILDAYHRPHWDAVRRRIARRLARGRPVVHVSVHSFTPVRGGVRRHADIGLLYDPARRGERDLATAWKRALCQRDPALRVRSNYPYRGTSDGLTTALRRELPARDYVGIELEISQRFWRPRSPRTAQVLEVIAASLAEVLDTN